MKDATRQVTARDAILDATDRLLTRYGYKKMTIDDLAQEVGIGKGSIYLHFSSKEEIALSHIDRIIERLMVVLNEIGSSDESAGERLRKMLVARVLVRFDSVQHYTQSLNDLLLSIRPSLLERRKRYFEEEARVFAGVIEDGQRSGALTAGDATDIANTLLSATNSLLPYSLSTAELGARKDLAARAGKIAELLIRGLSAV